MNSTVNPMNDQAHKAVSIHSIPKDRTKLEKELAEWLEAGNKIAELEYQCNQIKKEQIVRKGIFYTAQFQNIYRNTGVPPTRLKQLQNSLKLATRSEIETLFNYFKRRMK